jgi:hypothetical protein
VKKHWQIKATDILIDGKSIYSGSTSKAIIRTSSPIIEIPYDDFRNMKDKLDSLSIEGLSCTLEPPVCKVLGRCSTAIKLMKNFGFSFGDNWQYNPDLKDLLYDVTISKVDYCQLLISTKEDRSTSEIGLGAPFLKSFFTILNFENYKVGFAVGADSDAFVLNVPLTAESSVLWIIIAIIALIGLIIGGYVLWKIYERRKISGDIEKAETINKLLVK